VEAGYNTSTVVPASRKRRQKGNTVSDETAKYGYWSFNDLTNECKHSKLQTHVLVREDAIGKRIKVIVSQKKKKKEKKRRER
jgi:hypothetical protein